MASLAGRQSKFFMVLLVLIFSLPVACGASINFGQRGACAIGSGRFAVDSQYIIQLYGNLSVETYGNAIVRGSVVNEDLFQVIQDAENIDIIYVKYTIEEEKWYNVNNLLWTSYYISQQEETLSLKRASLMLSCSNDSRFLMFSNGGIKAHTDLRYGRAANLPDARIWLSRNGEKVYAVNPEELNCTESNLSTFNSSHYVPTCGTLWEDMTSFRIRSVGVDFARGCKMIICGPTVTAVTDDMISEYTSGFSEHQEKGSIYAGVSYGNTSVTLGWVGPGTHRVINIEYLQITFSADFSLYLDEVEIYASMPQCEINGTLYAPNANGRITIGGDAHQIENEELWLSGNFYVQPWADTEGDCMEVYVGNDFVSIATPRFSKTYPWAGTVEITLAAAILGALAVLFRYGFMLLHFRLNSKEVLEHNGRKRIYELIKSDPGISVKQIKEKTGMSWGVLLYHLEVLHHFSYVRFQKWGKERRVFLTDRTMEERVRMCALSDLKNKKIIEVVRSKEGVTLHEIGETIGICLSAASKRVQTLERVGLVRRVKEGRIVRHYLIMENLPRL